MNKLAVCAGVALLMATPLAAQRVAPDCTYHACALGIAPVWNGLDVVQGADGTAVASLGFFWPRSVRGAFAGNDSATAYAVRALRVRRAAALLTDVGALALAYATVRQLDGGLPRRDAVIAAAGAGAFALSVPLQFSADHLLSRAVWWHNERYAP
jgi:hypothetical protein